MALEIKTRPSATPLIGKCHITLMLMPKFCWISAQHTKNMIMTMLCNGQPQRLPLDYVIDSNDTGTRDEAQASVTFEKSFNENLSSHKIGLRQTKYESSTVADGKTTDNIKTGVRYLFKKAFDDNKIDQTSTLGSLILEKTYDKNNLTPTQKREAFAVGGELRHKFEDATSIQAGYRSESSDKYETAQTWKLALLKPLSDKTNLIFDSGTGVVNPTYCEIYGGTACFGSQGNPNIKPEKN